MVCIWAIRYERRFLNVAAEPLTIQHRDGAGLVLNKRLRPFPWLELIWAGGSSPWQVEAAVAKVPLLRMEIVKRSDNIKRFVVLPRRCVVGRTFSWFGRTGVWLSTSRNSR